MKIVFLDHYTLNSDGLDIDILKSLGEVDLYPTTNCEEVIIRSIDADVIITNKVIIDRHILSHLPKLRLIAVAATGYNNIDTKAAIDNGVTVCNVRGYSTESVVQHTFALILSILNKVEHYHQKVRMGRWESRNSFSFYDHSINEISGKTLGIIGYGTIGKRVAEVATAFGMQVLAFRRNHDPETNSNHEITSLENLISNSDIISCHAPLNEESYHIINEKSINKMKQSCVIINTARGDLINEADLAYALKVGRIAGAGLDTLSKEPPQNNQLINAPNCIVTPHQAWASVDSRCQLVEGLYQNIKAFKNGRPINVVNF